MRYQITVYKTQTGVWGYEIQRQGHPSSGDAGAVGRWLNTDGANESQYGTPQWFATETLASRAAELRADKITESSASRSTFTYEN